MSQSAWLMLLEGRYREAECEYDSYISAHPDVDNGYVCRAQARLGTFNARGALDDLSVAQTKWVPPPWHRPTKTKRFDSDQIVNLTGVCHWILGDKDAALACWSEMTGAFYRGRVNYSSDLSAGMGSALLLWFGCTIAIKPELMKTANQLIAKLRTSKLRPNRLESWPGPIANFMDGSLDQGTLVTLTDSSTGMRPRMLCQAHFAIATRAAEVGDLSAYRRWMASAAAHPIGLMEFPFHLARWESRTQES